MHSGLYAEQHGQEAAGQYTPGAPMLGFGMPLRWRACRLVAEWGKHRPLYTRPRSKLFNEYGTRVHCVLHRICALLVYSLAVQATGAGEAQLLQGYWYLFGQLTVAALEILLSSCENDRLVFATAYCCS